MRLPNDWKQLRLRELTVRTKLWNPKEEPRDQLWYVDVSGVDRERLEIFSQTLYSPGDAPTRARKLVQTGDTIFATVRPTLRRIAKVPAALDGEIVSTAFCVLRPDPHLIEADFLFYVVQLDQVMSGVAASETGASYPAVRDSDLLNECVPVPPLPEQRTISAVLNEVRRTLLSEWKCETDAEALKRVAMRDMFTRGLTREAQKETEIGPVPESWVVEPLGAHHMVVSGGTPSRANQAYWEGGTIPWVKTTEVNYAIISETEEHITLNGLNESAAKLLPAGTLLLAMYGQGVTRGKVAILGLEAACNQACAAILPSDEFIEPRYLYHFLCYRYDDIRQLAHGGHQQNLNLEIVRGFPLAFPADIGQQRQIVSALDAVDRKIDLHRRKRGVIDDLFKALLNKLMTGEIRITDLDLSALTATPPTEMAVT